MNSLIPLLITLASLGAQPTPPVEPGLMQKCIGGTSTVLRRIQTMVAADSTFELHTYSQDQAMRLLETLNADPPATQYTADQIMTLVDTSEDGNDKTLVILITRGCMTKIFQTPRKNWREVLSKSIGIET
jgi:hypothetical protein